MGWFFYGTVVSTIKNKDFKLFLDFGQTLALFSIFGECAKIFQQFKRTLQGQYFNHVRWLFITELQEKKMQLKFLACLPEKFLSAYSPNVE